MKSSFLPIATMMMAMTGLLGQGFGGQPSAFGPQYPQVFGVNAPRAPQSSPVQFPGCSDIQSIGSPILLNFQAQKIIEDAIKLQTQGTFVRYVYFSDATPAGITVTATFSKIYTLIFEIRDQSGPNYVGVLFDNPTNGIGSVKFLKFILNPNIEVVKKVLKVANAINFAGHTCGDLKMIYNSFGNDSRSSLNGQFPGQNRNGLSPALLKALKDLASKNASSSDYYRVCHPSRYVKLLNYWKNYDLFASDTRAATEAELATTFTAPWSVDQVTRCHPEGKRVVQRLALTCNLAGSVGHMATAQVVFRTPYTDALEIAPATAFGTGTVTSTYNIEFTDLVEKVSLFWESFNGAASFKWWVIKTFDKDNKVIQAYACGDASLLTNAGLPARETVAAKDLIGIWVAKSSAAATNLGAFGFIKYQ